MESTLPAKQEITAYQPITAELAQLREATQGRIFDLMKTADLEDAKKYRWACVKARGKLDKARKEASADLVEKKKRIDATAKTIEAQILEIETPLETKITEHEAKKEAEKKAKAEAEAARIEGIRRKLQDIVTFERKAYDARDSAAISLLGDDLIMLDIDESYGEFESQARSSRETVLTRLKAIFDHRVAAEAEAKRVAEEAEKQRAEAARLKAEREAFAAEQARIQAEAEAKREQERAEFEAELAAIKAEDDRVAKEAREAELAAIKAEDDRVAKEAREAEAAKLAEERRLAKIEADRVKAEQDDLAAKLREQQAELDRQKAEIEAAKPKPDDTPIYRGGPRFAPPSELGEAIGTLLQAQDAERRGQSEAEGWTQKTIRQAIESAFAAEPPVDSLAIGFGDPGPTSAAANGYYDEPPASVDPVIPAKLWMFWLGSLAGGWVVAFDESAPDTLIVSYDETKNEGIAAYYAEYFGMPCRPVRVK